MHRLKNSGGINHLLIGFTMRVEESVKFFDGLSTDCARRQASSGSQTEGMIARFDDAVGQTIVADRTSNVDQPSGA
jgi:hypothetical protein